jgi:hypothetical protein
MTNLHLVDMPKELKHHALDILGDKIEVLNAETFQKVYPFMHEAAYYHGLKTVYPWDKDQQKACVAGVISLWKELRLEAETAIQKQDKEKTVLTIKSGVRFFLECLYWSNDRPVNLLNGLVASEQLSLIPFNAEERLSYILSRPGGYHSYRQLDELFKELEKQFAIKMIKRK